ncbi:hypothetical protein C8R44DRAFT_751546 [Mycena epipterygia]|nr:hypothetical protein C8R44DRAFT_751546 [Mycena epipterygia]
MSSAVCAESRSRGQNPPSDIRGELVSIRTSVGSSMKENVSILAPLTVDRIIVRKNAIAQTGPRAGTEMHVLSFRRIASPDISLRQIAIMHANPSAELCTLFDYTRAVYHRYSPPAQIFRVADAKAGAGRVELHRIAAMLDGLKVVAGSTDPSADLEVLEDLLLEAFRALSQETATNLIQIH